MAIANVIKIEKTDNSVVYYRMNGVTGGTDTSGSILKDRFSAGDSTQAGGVYTFLALTGGTFVNILFKNVRRASMVDPRTDVSGFTIVDMKLDRYLIIREGLLLLSFFLPYQYLTKVSSTTYHT